MGQKLRGPGSELYARDLAKWVRDNPAPSVKDAEALGQHFA
jgi:hypothetical protein